MEQTHELLFELFGGPNPPSDSRYIPHVALQRGVWQDLLLHSADPFKDAARVLERFKVTAKVAVTNFQASLGSEDIEELTALGNAARHVFEWLSEIEESLQVPDKIKMIVNASGPLAWLEVLIKVLEFKSLHHEAV